MDYAARGGQIEIVEMMLERGANNYNYVMSHAADREFTDIVNLIKSYQNK